MYVFIVYMCHEVTENSMKSNSVVHNIIIKQSGSTRVHNKMHHTGYKTPLQLTTTKSTSLYKVNLTIIEYTSTTKEQAAVAGRTSRTHLYP